MVPHNYILVPNSRVQTFWLLHNTMQYQQEFVKSGLNLGVMLVLRWCHFLGDF